MSRSIKMMFVAIVAVWGMGQAIAPANAVTVELDFTASGYLPGAPNDPVIGVITYQANSLGANINSLSSISLTVGSHTYALSELGFQQDFVPGFAEIGGLINGLNTIHALTDDFFLIFNYTQTSGALTGNLGYSTSTRDVVFNGTASSYVLSEVATTPLPGALPLFASGLGALGLFQWGRKWKAHAAA
jgi:hypothetical protein